MATTTDLSKYKQQKLDLQIEAEAKILDEAEKRLEERKPAYKGPMGMVFGNRPLKASRVDPFVFPDHHVELGVNAPQGLLLAGTPI